MNQIDRLQPASARWRRWARAGALHGPRWFVRFSPLFFGPLFALLLPKQRAAIRSNLERIRGRRGWLEREWLTLATFVNYAHCLAESLAAEREGVFHAKLELEGAQHLQALTEGQGFVVVTAHVGPWEIAARHLARWSARPVLVVLRRETDPRAMHVSDGIRREAGLKTVYLGDDPLAALPLLEHLRQGGIVAGQMDRAFSGMRASSIQAHGAPLGVPVGLLKLAAAVGVPALPVFCWRAGFFDYRLRVCPPLRPVSGEPESVEAALRAFGARLEQVTREHPTQWFHFLH